MKLSLRLHQASQYHINIAGTTYTGISSCSPIGIGGMYPEGFAAMMRLYSHAVVDRVQVTFGVTPSVGGNIPDDYDLQSRPFTASSLIIPWYDFDNGNNLTPEQIQSYPGCVTKMIGARSADGEVRFYQSVDIRTALANYREEHYACKSTSAGVITVPALNANIGSVPMICLWTANQDGGADRYFNMRRDVTYHMTFSMRHCSSLTANA